MSKIGCDSRPNHFVYEDKADFDKLFQGDILKKTPQLIEVLSEYHSYYAKHKRYDFFIVLTQSCDLNFDDASRAISAPYITIAAIRPVEDAFYQEAKQYQSPWQVDKQTVDTETKEKLILFGERLVNNNESNYFYIHKEQPTIEKQACAFLSLSVALRGEHYKICRDAKIAQLKESFRAKLGWLVGNLYSRIGTENWAYYYPESTAKKESAKYINDFFIHLPKEKIERGLSVIEQEGKLDELSSDDIFERVRKTRIPKKNIVFAKRAEILLDKSDFINQISNKLIGFSANDKELANSLEELIGDKDISKKVLELLIGYLKDNFTDTSFRNRDKIIAYISTLLSSDEIVKKIITSNKPVFLEDIEP